MSLDLYFDRVSLLLPMRGENNGTEFRDWSTNRHTVDRFGDTKTVTTQSKFYGSSGMFDGNGDYLSIASDSALNLGLSDFTIATYLRRLNNNTPYQGILSTNQPGWNSVCRLFLVYGQNAPVSDDQHRVALARWVQSGSTNIVRSTTQLALDQWYHVAVTRQNGVFRLFVNGVLEGEVTADISLDFSVGGTNIGWQPWDGVNGYLGAYLQDLIVVKGLALYTSNFTPPGPQLGRFAGTVKDPASALVSRAVRVWPAFPGGGTRETRSDATTGAFELIVPRIPHTVQVVAESGDGCDIWLPNRTPASF